MVSSSANGGVRAEPAETAPLVRAVVALFRLQATPEAGAAKKKAKKKSGGAKGGIAKPKRGSGVAAFARRFGDRSFFDGGGGGALHDY
eukprot:1508867-Prymnesium_polylepis.1